MATGGLYGSTTTGDLVATSGAESTGLYGNNTNIGGTYFEWFIFYESTTAPATPTGGSWNFLTNTGTAPSGWSSTPPTNPTHTVWASISIVNSRSPAALTWTAPATWTQQGPTGTAATIAAGTTTTGAPGTSATVTNSGTSSAAVFNFVIPRGDVGATGATGATGTAATVAVGSTTTLTPGSAATVTNSGTTAAAVFNFGVPQGLTGATGATGATGPAGMNWRGNWSSGTFYSVNDGVFDTVSGSSYIATATSTNQQPPNGAYWNVLAQKGANGTGVGTVTSVDVSGGTTGLTSFGGPITSAGTVTLAGTLNVANGGTGATTAAGARTSLGATTVGSNMFTLANPSAITFPRFNADNTVSSLDAATFRTAIGAGTSSTTGTVTSVAASVPAFLSISGSPITASGTLAIGLSGTALPVANGGTGVTTSTGTGSVVLNTGASLGSATVSDYETFTSVAAPTYTEGRLWYDSTQKALTYNSDISGNSLHVGQETQLKVRNGTGSTIAKGAPVYITSTATGVSFPNIALAKADTLTTGNCIGLTNEAIASGADGYVVINGILNGVNTGTFTVGDVLYVSPYSAGQLMNTFPPTGYPVKIGVVSFVNSSTGSIYINQSNAFVQASSVIGTLAIANGGTGTTTATAAFNALAPTQTGNSGKYLTTDGTNTSWATNPLGTVTSVGGTGTVNGLTLTGTVTTSGNLTLGGTLDLSSPPAIGATAANTGAFTTLSASSTVTLSGGTANGVAYLNGSKILTTGTALTFDGSKLGVGTSTLNGSLTVKNPSVTGNQVIFAIQAGTSTSQLASWDLNQTTDVSTFGTDYGAPLAFKINSAEQMRLTSTGLGIGTSSPDQKLVVQGSNASLKISDGTYSSFVATISSAGGYANGSTVGQLYLRGQAGIGFSGNGGSATQMALDSSGNLGLGVTPSAWSGFGNGVLEIGGNIAAFLGGGGNQLFLGNNAYFNGTNWIYKRTAGASYAYQYAGAHQWYTAPSGTAGNAITFTQAMTLDASGNLGIGTTSPGNTLTVGGSNPQMQLSGSGTSTDFRINAAYGGAAVAALGTVGAHPMFFFTSNTERARIDSSGNVGIGTTSPTKRLQVESGSTATGGQAWSHSSGTVYARIGIVNPGTSNDTEFGTVSNNDLRLITNNTERARIDSSGNLLVGTTNASGTAGLGFKVLANATGAAATAVTDQSTNGGQTNYNYYSTGAGAYRFYVGAGGTVFATSIVITAISDQRLKENVRDIDTGLDAIMALKPRRFDWKEGKGQDKKNAAGFIAQEFETVFPECVSTSKAGEDGIEYKNINHETLIPTLVKAIQELKAEFDAYKATHP